jgi:uncharacterized protein (TIGR02246 family)
MSASGYRADGADRDYAGVRLREAAMRRAMVFAALGFMLWLGLRCDARAGGQTREIDAVRAEWVRTLEARALEPSLALFTDDAAFLNPDGARIAGKEAIRGLYQQIFATYSGAIVLDSKQTGISGGLAYDSGLFHETLTTLKTGEKQQLKGSYLMVFRHEPDGKWRIVQQVWTEAPPENAGHS